MALKSEQAEEKTPAVDDNFDDAFAQFANPEVGAEKQDESGDEEKEAEAKDDADEAKSDEQAEEGSEDAGKETEAEAPEGDKSADDKTVEAGEDDKTDALIDRLGELLKTREPEEKKPEEKSQAQDELPALYNEEEQQFLSEYDKDWGDVVKGEALKRRAEYREIVQLVFSEVGKVLAPLQQTVETLATRTHLADIESTVPDYDELRDNVISWVEEQPAYLQSAYKQVIQAGTADEVIDLIERYREATGNSVKGKVKDTERKSVEPPEATKKAAESLAPVSTKRSVIPADENLEDFDTAFRKFASANKG